MPYSLLNQINPVTLHVFYVSLLKVMGVGLLVFLLGEVWFWKRSGSREASSPVDSSETSVFEYPPGYRVLWWGLGLLWLIDGLLQAQPAMATSMFVDMDVASNLSSQPHWLVSLLGDGIQLWTNHPMTSAIFSVVIQVGIGLAMLLGAGRRWGFIGLYVSLVWSLPVWIYGEGLGDVLTGKASWLLGSPGAVVFYVLGAVALLLPIRFWQSGQVLRWTRYMVAGMWLLLAGWQAWPHAGYWSRGLFHIFRNNSFMPQPGVLLVPIVWIMNFSRLYPILLNGSMVAIMAYLGLALILKKTGRTFWIIMILWLLASWWLGQDFGIVGGVGTDPQSAPPAIILMLGGWYYAHPVEEDSTHRPGRGRQSQSLRALGVAATGVLSLLFLVFGFVIPQVVVAQGDRPALRTQSQRIQKASSIPTRQSVALSHSIPASRWMQFNASERKVHVLLQASVNTFGSLAFDGYSNGFLTMTIPQGWRVDATFVNEQTILKNSAMIVPLSQLRQNGPFTPAFPGAFSPDPTQGVNRGVVQHFQFVAAHSGQYAVVSAVPDGQSSSGMWDNLVIKNVTKPTIRVK
jgi:hypothetical protein